MRELPCSLGGLGGTGQRHTLFSLSPSATPLSCTFTSTSSFFLIPPPFPPPLYFLSADLPSLSCFDFSLSSKQHPCCPTNLFFSLLPCRAYQAPCPPSSCAHPSAWVALQQQPSTPVALALGVAVATLVGAGAGVTPTHCSKLSWRHSRAPCSLAASPPAALTPRSPLPTPVGRCLHTCSAPTPPPSSKCNGSAAPVLPLATPP